MEEQNSPMDILCWKIYMEANNVFLNRWEFASEAKSKKVNYF